jgi:hypothetical protein
MDNYKTKEDLGRCPVCKKLDCNCKPLNNQKDRNLLFGSSADFKPLYNQKDLVQDFEE